MLLALTIAVVRLSAKDILNVGCLFSYSLFSVFIVGKGQNPFILTKTMSRTE